MFPLLQGLINSDSANGVTKVEPRLVADGTYNGMLIFSLKAFNFVSVVSLLCSYL